MSEFVPSSEVLARMIHLISQNSLLRSITSPLSRDLPYPELPSVVPLGLVPSKSRCMGTLSVSFSTWWLIFAAPLGPHLSGPICLYVG